MCAIIGMTNICGNKITESDLGLIKNSINLHLKKRGPDSEYLISTNKHTVLGGTRLAITCDKNNGQMPFTMNSVSCVYNGEIYNYKDFSNCSSDGEIIIPLYKQYGINFLNHLDGEFSIALHDEEQDILYLVRDCFGTKPLFFTKNNQEIIWASSESAINEIRKTKLCKTIKDPVYKHTFTTAEPYTNYDKIWKIPPGHYLEIKNRSVSLVRYNYWRSPDRSSIDQLYDTILEIFEKRFSANKRLAIPLSGGIDSGIIAFLADRLEIDYHIFAIDKMFSRNTEESEFIYRRIEKLNNYKEVDLLDVNTELYNQALDSVFQKGYYDSFRLDSGMIPTYVLYKSISTKGLKIAIDGTGGDELFHGYSFRNDFIHPNEWPKEFEKNPYYYSLFSTLLSYTEKSDRAAGFFSIENRVPFQSKKIMNISMGLQPKNELKWPLREIFIKHINYGQPSKLDISCKYGFSLKNIDKSVMHKDLKKKWLANHNIELYDLVSPTPFPFKIGGHSMIEF